MSCKDVMRAITPAWASSARLLAVLLPVLLLGVTRGLAQSEGSNSGDLSRRIRYDLDYLSTGSGNSVQHSHLLLLLTRGQVDTLQPPVDSATTAREERAAEEAGRRTGHNSEAIPFGGHWYAAAYTNDSLWVLGRALHRPGGDTALVVMVDHADHVGGEPAVSGVATITTPMPAAFWTMDTDPVGQHRVLLAWLQRDSLLREFLR
ncbi:MAG: hypothetical protein ABSG61_15610 [Gemmatimonadales bacterium]